MRLLLINPRFPESFWSFKWAMDRVLPGRRAVNPPLGLATLAALCPPEWDITIVDENVEPIPLAPAADLVGVCGMGVQFPRQRELLRYYRNEGYRTVAGGSYASLCPELYEPLADTVVAGEAEYIWPQFCRDLEQGTAKRLYHETGVVSLADTPVPRFDLLPVDRYQTMSLQFSRGCPFRCEFCDIIVMFGRRPRTKSPEQVGRELDALRALGIRSAFFVDDNLIGNKPVAKDLLKYLAEYQREHDYRFHFGTEASLNLAQDAELLELFRQAGFGWVFLGIESPDEESLKETLKFQNTRQDLLTSLRAIYAHGVDIFAGFIIGFDHDTVATFERQETFIRRSGIQAAMIGLLQALPKTPLYERLEKAGRLRTDANGTDNSKLSTNVNPVGMSYEEMVAGYRALHERLFDDEGIAARVKNKNRYLASPAATARRHSLWQLLGIGGRFLLRGLLPGGPARIVRFLGSVPWSRPLLIPRAVEDWILGLAMRDYIDRHFRVRERPAVERARDHVQALERALRRYLKAGSLEVSLDGVRQAAASVSLRLHGWVDRGFYRRARRQLSRVLRDSTASVTLRIDELRANEVRHLQRLLRRLSRYGDRISVVVHERLREVVHIDSSLCHLVLERS